MLRRQAFRLPPHPASVSLARLRVHDHLAAWGHKEESAALRDAVLLVSELVTNAVCHGLVPDREFEVAVTVLADGDCFIEVSDESPNAPEPREAEALEEGGRGLRLLDALAEAWGVWQRGRHGKTVWALVRG
ncbi:ATP-binding protein [Streptomyces sp. BA2]|uniref:ATP-binding protein n=1 Tax=Streptomyces sp. BA2 TaxID=436595 RepID=UPI00132AE02F|nr:ATP-binding protein [Streptomyces sp. BA2]MWA13123.1 ATP-binding protein [Streptomyces sp. BA2]